MLKTVKLTKPWGERPVGEVVEVDPTRAAYLVEHGLAKEVDNEAKAPAEPPVDKMVRRPPSRKGTGRR